ncbi:MAG: DUF2267 domain-containing protein [Sphaerobacter sp.]|nr:DUF2267 domain-containing protein [Sphaerobacter sp.]
MDKTTFVNLVRERLGDRFAATPDECIRAVFQTLHERLPEGQAGHIAAHLPQALQDEWALGAAEMLRRRATGAVEAYDREEFLDRVRQRAGLGSVDEAVHATRAVFAALQAAIPEKDRRDTAGALPAALRGLWETAAVQGTEPRPDPAGQQYEDQWLPSETPEQPGEPH